MNYHGFKWDQIPKGDTAVLHVGRRYDDGFVKEPSLIDSGSSISTLTPQEAKKIEQSTEWTIEKGKKKFVVENGGQKEELFSGDYMKLPIRIVNSDQWVNVKFYIMPHNHCLFQMILGLRDMKKVGYDICTRISDNTLLFKHSTSRKKVNYNDENEVLAKCELMGDEFAAYQLIQKQRVCTTSELKDEESKDSEESEEDGRFPSHRF